MNSYNSQPDRGKQDDHFNGKIYLAKYNLEKDVSSFKNSHRMLGNHDEHMKFGFSLIRLIANESVTMTGRRFQTGNAFTEKRSNAHSAVHLAFGMAK